MINPGFPIFHIGKKQIGRIIWSGKADKWEGRGEETYAGGQDKKIQKKDTKGKGNTLHNLNQYDSISCLDTSP